MLFTKKNRVHMEIIFFHRKQIIYLFLSIDTSGNNFSSTRVRGVLFDTNNRNIYFQILDRWVKTKVPSNCIVKMLSRRLTDAAKLHFRLTPSTNILSMKNPTCYSHLNSKYKNLKITPCGAISRNSTEEGSVLMRRPSMI